MDGEVGVDVVELIGDSRFTVEETWKLHGCQDAKYFSALPVKLMVLANSVIVRSY